MPGAFHQRAILRVRDGRAEEVEDDLVIEEPLEIRVNGESVAVTMRTPGDDADLVRGFLRTEGLVRGADEILDVRVVEDPANPARSNILEAVLPAEVAAARAWRRNFYATSSCGVCGKASIDMVRQLRPRVESALRVEASLVAALPDRLREAQAVFDRTGGLHASGLFDAEGRLLVLREDVGRHNAVDKVVGWALAEGVDLGATVLQVSGRAGFEIVQKAAVAGSPVVAAVGAPSYLAAALAEEAGVTLCGFVRGGGMNVYAHAERLLW